MALELHQRAPSCMLAAIVCLLAIRGLGATSLECPSDFSENSDSESLVVSWDVPPNSTCSQGPDVSFMTGDVTEVTCTSSINDTETCSFTVTVTDTASPVYTNCPTEPISIDTDPEKAVGTADWNLQITDNLRVEHVTITCNSSKGQQLPIGSHSVMCTATDQAGNTRMCLFQVVITDNEPPVFTFCPESAEEFIQLSTSSIHSQSFSASVDWQQPTATDNSAADVTLEASAKPRDMFPLGTTMVTYNATDSSGNINSCEFSVKVLVRPPSEHIYIDPGVSDPRTCLRVKWPITNGDGAKEKSLFYWQEEEGKMATPPQEVILNYEDQSDGIPPTYGGPLDICKLAPGELITVEVDEARLQRWTKPDKPEQLSLVPGTLSASSIELTWKPVSLSNVQQYMVKISSGGYISVQYVTKMTSRLRVDGLRPGTSHTATVQAIVGSGTMRMKSDSRLDSFQTASLAASELMAYKYTESTITVAWSRSLDSSSTEPYMLFIEPKDATKNFLTVGSGSNAMFEGLKPNTEYYIRLIHNNGLSLSTTQKTRPAPVGNLRPTEVLEDSFTLGWDTPTDGYVDSYEIYISPGSDIDPIQDVTGTRYTFSSLEPKTEYYVSVVSVYEGMKSVPQTLMVTTGVTPPADPGPLNIIALAIGAGLGLIAVILIVSILVIFCKIRRKKSEILQDRGGQRGYQRNGNQGDHHYMNGLFGLRQFTLGRGHRPKVPEPEQAPSRREPPQYDLPDING